MAASGGGSSAAGKKGGGDENVKVAVRCRPFNKREKGLGSKSIVEIEGPMTRLLNPVGDPHEFTFDFSYDDSVSQDKVYEDLGAPILEKALSGFNATIFAYGQTGSGKTWSMMGDDATPREFPGIIPRLNTSLFDAIAARKESDTENAFLVSVSFLEIYNEVIKDLLNPSDKQLKIREHPKMGTYVEDLAAIVVEKASTVEELIEQGNKVRKVASTAMNARSSRSHSCFMLRIEQKRTEEHKVGEDTVRKETSLAARINLVDLAGSERADKTGASGKRLKEGAAINKSLTVLGNVINALAEGSGGKRRHIPYRDSKLTRLLQESLGGNALTVMVAAISPADDNHDETLSTLRYANRAKQIKNSAKRNEDVSEAVIRELREEIAELQRMLEESRKAAAEAEAAALAKLAAGGGDASGIGGGGAGGGGGGGEEEEDEEEKRKKEEAEAERIRELEEKIAALSHAKQASWEEQQRLSKQFEEERKRNLENEEKVRSVMQTIREDNKELLRRMRELVEEHGRLTRKYRKLKHAHGEKRDSLKAKMAHWQRLHEEDGGVEDGPHAEEMEAILTEVEELHGTLEGEQKELKELKAAIKENEEKQEEERAEAAAQRRLLQEDAELRKAIAAEEKKKLEEAAREELEAQIEAERKKLQESVEKERKELEAKYAAAGGGGAGSSARESELELELLNTRKDRDLLRIDLDRIQRTHESEIAALREEMEEREREANRVQLAMFRDMCDAFEEEKKALESRAKQVAKLLAQAAADIKALGAENDKLRRELYLEAAWEAPVGH